MIQKICDVDIQKWNKYLQRSEMLEGQLKSCSRKEAIQRTKQNKPHNVTIIQSVPLANEPGISLIILTPMKILQRNLNRGTFVVWEMKRNVSVVRFKFGCNILVSGKIIKEMLGSVASGTHCISTQTDATIIILLIISISSACFGR